MSRIYLHAAECSDRGIGTLEDVCVRDGIRLFLGWVTGDAHFLGL
ncbi:MAG TPA: hypothetical protein PKD53_08885 [Chloroflexaceae bacterium]|nr:hypothetical protein [Chloroflexaceae bacterium]